MLVAISRDGREGVVRPTRVQSSANLPHDRFWRHLDELVQRGLVTSEPLQVTPKGHEFLRQCADMQEFLLRFGLADESPIVRPSREHAPSFLTAEALRLR
jgi:predicted transcriptional regulator